MIVAWFGFALVFLTRKKPPQAPEKTRDRAAGMGIMLQGVAYGLTWSFTAARMRHGFRPIVPAEMAAQWALALLTVTIAVASVWLVLAAVRTLGKQWALAARLVQDHKLVTAGPYGFLRHPIYTGMLGMLIATGLAFSIWQVLLVALALFGVGTAIRVRSEEKLLRAAFGAEFDEYASRVPAVLPGAVRAGR